MKFLLKLTLILLIPQFLFAGDYFNSGDFAVYSWGDSSSLENAFQSISLIVSDNSFVINIKYIAVLVSTILAARFLIQEDVKSAFAEIAYVIGILTFVYGSTATVHIIDKRVNSLDYATVRTVGNVPWMLGFTAHTGSIFVDFIVREIDAASTDILPSFSYSRSGFIKAFQIMKSQVLLTQNYSNSNVSYRIVNNYFKKCIMRYSLDIPADKFAEIANPDGYITNVIKPVNLGISNKAYDNQDTCGMYYSNGGNEVNATGVEKALTLIGGVITSNAIKNNNVVANGELNKDILKLVSPTNKLSSLEQASSNLIAAQIYENSSTSSGVGVSGINIVNKSSAQASKLALIQNGSGQFAWMADMLPKAMHILTIIIVMAFLPMGVVVAALGMQKGLKNLMNYFFGYIAFQSLSIALAIVQNVVNGYAMKDALTKLVALGSSPTAAVNIPYYITYLSDMIGLSGMLGVAAIPLVIGIMYKGETAMAGGIATGVGGAYKSLGTRGAQEELNKNFSTNLAERNQAARMNEEERASRIMNSMGMGTPTSGTAIMALAEVEQGIEQVNRANAASHALTSDGGLEKLNAGAGVRSENEMANKMAYGEQAVRINGGEVRAISLASSAGAVDGAKAFGAIEGKGTAAQEIDASHRSSVGLAHAAGAVEGVREMHNIAGAGQAGINEGIIGETGDINTRGVSYKALATATEANAMKDLASIVQQGKEIDGQKHGMNNFIQAGRLKAINDTQTEMSTGEFGKENDYRTHAQQSAHIAAKNISEVVARRKMLGGKDNDGKVIEPWSADKVAKGMAIKSVEGEAAMMGATNALSNEKGSDDEAFRRAAAGSMEKGRFEQNALLGIGKKWASKDDAEKKAFMSKVQKVSTVSEFGKVEAAAANIKEHGGVKGAIADMVSLAQEGGKKDTKHAENLRTTFGDKHGGLDKVATFTTMSDGKDGKAPHAIKHSATLSDTFGTIDQSKIDSQLGQSAAIKANIAKGVSYAENAMYGEMSQQQSTRAKIKTQGGVDSAVATDVTEAKNKAGKQQEMLSSELAKQIQIANPKMPAAAAKAIADAHISGAKTGGDYIAKALKEAASLAGTMTAGKTASEMSGVNRAGGASQYVSRMARMASDKMGDTIGTQDQILDAYNLQASKANQYHPSVSSKNKDKFNEFVEDVEYKKAIAVNAPAEMFSTAGTVGTAAFVGAAGWGVQKRYMGDPIGRTWKAIDPLGKKKSDTLDGESQKSGGNNQHGNTQQGEHKKGQHTNSSNLKYTDSVPNNSEKVNTAKGRWRTKMAMAVGTTLFGAFIANASEGSNSSGDGTTLENIANTTGTAEMGVGLGTMVASTMSRFSSVAAGFAKFGARITPGVGLAYGAADGAYRVSQGDNLGAAMSAGIAAVSTVPVAGTALAIAGGVAQMATDYMGITGASNSPAPQHAQTAFSTQPGYNTQQAMQGNNSGGYMADSISRQTISSEIHFSNMKKLGVESNTTNYMQMKDLVELTKKANEDKMDDMLVGGGK